jgi:fermentation-respiration switch protein FrsA (DUF1100 family)
LLKIKRFGGRYWFNLFRVVVIFLLTTFLALTAAMSYRQAQVYLHPFRGLASGDLLKANDIQYQDIELRTKDGLALSAWYVPPKNGAVILLAHGYGAVRPEAMTVLFASHGFGVVAWDFRAHGKSGGNFSTLGYYEQLDVEAALDYALAQPNVKHIGAWGGSMGAATVVLTAAHRPEIEAVVSDSSFPTLEDAYNINVPQWPVFQQMVRFFVEIETGVSLDQVRPVDEIGWISPRPVLIIDGWEDGAIEMNSPYRLYDAARQPKQLWVENGVPHLGMYAMYPQLYTQKVIGFFNNFLLGQ